jgi:hypothetical protein
VSTVHPDHERPPARAGRVAALDPEGRSLAIARIALVGVGVAFFLGQLWLLPLDRPPLWDEAVYLSQLTPGMPALYFEPWHARGITVLLAPAALLGAGVEQVRVYLIALTSAGTVAAFWPWHRRIGVGAPIGAALACSSWVALAWSSRAMPNAPAAILAVAAVGWTACRLQEGRRWQLLLASGLLALLALTRPTEAAVLGAALGIVVLLVRREAWRDLLPLAVGTLAGWLPWLVEMGLRFGGLGPAIRASGAGQHFATLPVGESLARYLAQTGGTEGTSSLAGALWWGAAIVLTVVALTAASRDLRLAGALAGLGALLLATEYVVFVTYHAPRFLLPAAFLASLGAGAGLARLLRGPPAARFGALALLALVLPWAVWQGGVVAATRPPPGVYVPQTVGTRIRELAGDSACVVVTPRAHPQVSWTARCAGLRHLGVPGDALLEHLGRGGTRVFVIQMRPSVPERSLLASLVPERYPREPRDWYLYVVPPA